MREIIKKYQSRVIEDWGAYCSQDYKNYAAYVKRRLKANLPEGYEVVSLKPNHYDFSGFISTPYGGYIYVSQSITRGMPLDLFSDSPLRNGVLFRTAKTTHDYTGGHNNWSNLLGLPEAIVNLAEREAREREVA